MWGRWPPRGVSGPPPPRPRERGDQRPPPDSPDASKHPEEARNSRMVPAKAAHWGKDWVKNPLQAVSKSSRAASWPASGCASTPRSAGHRVRNGKGRTRGRNTGNQPRYLRNHSRIGQQTGKIVSRNLLLLAGSPRTHGRLRGFRHPADVLTDRRFIDRVDEKNGQEGRFIHDAHGTILTAAEIISDIIIYIVISILYISIK